MLIRNTTYMYVELINKFIGIIICDNYTINYMVTYISSTSVYHTKCLLPLYLWIL